jgi:hypothetical protein
MSTTVNWNSIPAGLAVAPACGLPASRFVPASLQSQAQTVAQGNVPPSAPSDFVPYCTACLIARGLIYFKNNPGDCGTPTPLNFEDSQLAGGAASIAVGIASMAGASLPGIGVAISAIQGIFAAHAQAVATEQSTICQVAGVINQVFAYYDTLVAEGEISPSTAYAGIQNFLQQANEQLQTIEKTCNAACVYQGILKAHAAFCAIYYPAIAPEQISAHAPGAPPSSFGTAPGGVISVGASGSPTVSVAGSAGVLQSTEVSGASLAPGAGASVLGAAPVFSFGPLSIPGDTLILVGLLALAAIIIAAVTGAL